MSLLWLMGNHTDVIPGPPKHKMSVRNQRETTGKAPGVPVWNCAPSARG
jgi:hypothetical protein